MSNCFAITYEGKEMEGKKEIEGAILHNLKIGDMRIIDARRDVELEIPLTILAQKVLNFEERCNNEFAERRELSDKKKQCPVLNHNLVESVKIPFKLDYKYEKLTGEKERFVLWRKIYNREEYYYYDLVTVVEINSEITISYKMLSDDEAKALIDNPRARNTAFSFIEGGYVLKSDGPAKTKVQMLYLTKTDHWLLNSGPALSVIYKNVAKGFNNTLEQLNQLRVPTMKAP
jgi:hypothetical protein